LVHPDKQYLQYCYKQIKTKIEELGLTLNKKTSLSPLKFGTIFLKWHYYLLPTGKVIMKINKRKRAKHKRRLRKLFTREQQGQVIFNTTKNSLVSFLANAKRGNTYKLCREMRQFYHELTGSDLNDRKLS